MTVMPLLMFGSSHLQIGTPEESAGFVGISGKIIKTSRGPILNNSHPIPIPIPIPSPPPSSSSSSFFHPPHSSITMNPYPPPKPVESCSTSMPPPSRNSIYQSTTNSTASSSHTSGGSCPPLYSGSDDEQQHRHHHLQSSVDERRQKRMLSNRESARRSRMRKQLHLDDLRTQIVQLRAENNHILNKLNISSQQYMQMEDENRALRSYAMDLCQKLQSLGIALQQAGGGLHSMGFDTGFMDSIMMPEMDVNPFS